MSTHQELHHRYGHFNTRRHFLRQCMSGLGALALHTLGCTTTGAKEALTGGGIPHFAPRARSVIYLHMAGAPSQLELFDYKPTLERLHGQLCPPSLMEGKRFAFIKGQPLMLGPQARFGQHGQSGAWISDYLPHLSQVADDLCFLKAMHTEEFNHAPAQLMMHTGSPRPGRPSMGSWVTYGLGSENDDLPGFIVLVSRSIPDAGKMIWGNGYIPGIYQGVQCTASHEPIANLANPAGIDSDLRRASIDALNRINELEWQETGDPETLTRIEQYELAFRMQATVPDAMSIDREPQYIRDLYGVESGKVTFANNCLLARRLVERGVRFVQLYDRGWDTHGAGPGNGVGDGLLNNCRYVDRAIYALITDLKQRGLLDETLIVWGGEFGRTPMLEARAGKDFLGRDHHNEAFTIWMAGGGTRAGHTHGQTDDIGYYGIDGRVHVHDLQATILHLLGIDHKRLTYRYQGRQARLTDVHGHVVKDVLG